MSAGAYLVMSGPPATMWVCPVEEQHLVIGREAGCRIRVIHPIVSREHCEVWDDKGKAFVRDLDSANGTYVNGVKVRQRRLRFGDLLQVGPLIMQLARPLSQEEKVFGLGEEDEETAIPTVPIEPLPGLSTTEQTIVRCLVEGMSERQVAGRLHMTANMLHTHIKQIYKRLRISSRVELAKLYFRGQAPAEPDEGMNGRA
jgi:DNA-binding CsgD family transcriptional regulator